MCHRYQGGAKEGGPQYPQAIAVGSSLHVIFSVNKEVLLLSICRAACVEL
jgi:hypothetical protein